MRMTTRKTCLVFSNSLDRPFFVCNNSAYTLECHHFNLRYILYMYHVFMRKGNTSKQSKHEYDLEIQPQ
jgi:hypothetical protein